MFQKINFISIILALLVPFVASAMVVDIYSLTVLILSLLEQVGFLFWVLAIALFFWGLVKFMNNAGDTAEHEKGKKFIMWGLICFVVIVSLWGIVRMILVDTLDISPSPTEFIDKNDTLIAP